MSDLAKFIKMLEAAGISHRIEGDKAKTCCLMLEVSPDRPEKASPLVGLDDHYADFTFKAGKLMRIGIGS